MFRVPIELNNNIIIFCGISVMFKPFKVLNIWCDHILIHIQEYLTGTINQIYSFIQVLIFKNFKNTYKNSFFVEKKKKEVGMLDESQITLHYNIKNL